MHPQVLVTFISTYLNKYESDSILKYRSLWFHENWLNITLPARKSKGLVFHTTQQAFNSRAHTSFGGVMPCMYDIYDTYKRCLHKKHGQQGNP